jgi:hypothetical protein
VWDRLLGHELYVTALSLQSNETLHPVANDATGENVADDDGDCNPPATEYKARHDRSPRRHKTFPKCVSEWVSPICQLEMEKRDAPQARVCVTIGRSAPSIGVT